MRLTGVWDEGWRRLTSPLRPQPDFVIVGAQRAGTTAVYSWLCRHPLVRQARVKEVHYFDRHFHRGPRWYRQQFPITRGAEVTGEATPYLLFHPLVPDRVAAELPTTRFIVLLREPVQRAVSHYWHAKRLGAETEPMETAFRLESERLAEPSARIRAGEDSYDFRLYSYRSRGHYAEQLERWFSVIDRSRFLILESEQVFRDPNAAVSVIAEWLGLPATRGPIPSIPVNPALREHSAPPQLIAELQEHFAPHNERLFTLLGRELWTDDGAARPSGAAVHSALV